MSFILGILFAFIGIVFSNFNGAQLQAADTERKADINSIYSKLEEYYNETSYYPLTEEVTEQGASLFPGIDGNALIDPENNKINAGEYTYTGTDCSIVGCAQYTLSATLSDGTKYTKQSLN